MNKLALKSLIKSIVFYSITNGLSRGLSLIIFPILISFLSVDEYGIFSLAISVSNLLVPILTISGTAGILREVSVKPSVSKYLLFNFSLISTLIFMLIVSIYYFTTGEINWFFYSLFIGYSYSIIELKLNNYRALSKQNLYGILILFKSLLLIGVVIIGYKIDLDINKFLSLYILGITIFILILVIFNDIGIFVEESDSEKLNKSIINLREVLKYTIFIVPHGLSLWVINSSDKYIIKIFNGDYDLGIYSIAYTISSVQFLINSGISIALPQVFYKNIRYWSYPKHRIIILFGFLFVSITFVVLYSLVFNNFRDFLLKYELNEQTNSLIKIIIPSLILVGCYQFYSIYIFYNKKTKALSQITFSCALINLGLNLLFVPLYGIKAAAYSTLLAFLLYFITIYLYSLKNNKNLRLLWQVDISVILLFVILSYLII